MKYAGIAIFFCVTCLSCNKTNYGTSVSIQNLLTESIEIEVYPVETPYSNTAHFTIQSGHETTILNTGDTDQTPQDLLLTTFDSIAVRIGNSESILLFSPDTVKYYVFNPYHHTALWNSRILEYDIHDMSKNQHEDQDYYFKIEPTLIISN